jgi:hypothetical protein
MSTRFSLRRTALVAGLLVIAACGGDPTQPVPPPAPPPPPPPPPSPVPVASVTVIPAASTLVPQQTVQLTAETRDAGGNVLSGRAISWTSGTPTAASVSAAGLVTGLLPGAPVITATSEGRAGTAAITVLDGGMVLPAGNGFSAGGGAVAIQAPAGAVAAGMPITVAALATPPAHPSLIPGTAWSLGPDGTTFAQPVTVRLTWAADQLPAGAHAEQIRVHRHDGTAWVPLQAGEVNVGTRTASGTTTAFSPFALIELPSHPVPVLTGLAPTSVLVGSPDFALTVTGTGFVSSSEVLWDGSPRPTTLVSATELSAAIAASDLLAPGTVPVSVRTPAPGGGTSASQSFQILPPPPTTHWTTMAVGSGGAIVGAPIRGIVANATGTGLAIYDNSHGNLTSFVGAMEMTGGTWIDRRDEALFGARFLASVAGSGPTDVYVGLVGSGVTGGVIPDRPATVLRWNGSAFSDLGWPGGAGVSPRALGMVAPGHLLVAAHDGALWRHTGGSWASVVGPTVATEPRALAPWSPDSAAIGRCATGNANVPLVAVLGSGGVTMLPPVPFTVSTLGALFTACAVDVLVRPDGEILAAFPSAVGRYTVAGGWTAVGTALMAAEMITRMAACGEAVYAGTDAGRVLRLQGAAFVEHVAGGIAATGPVGALHCDTNGTLRVGSRSGLVTRRSGSGWVDEHYAPTLRGVHLRSPTQGVLVGDDGLVLQWNGTALTRTRRSGSSEQLNGVWMAPDGSVFAVGNSFTSPDGGPAGAHFLRSTGGGFSSAHVVGTSTGTSIWGTATDNVLFIARSHPWIAASGGIHRWNGTSTSVPLMGTMDSPLMVSGSSAAFAIATGADGAVWRWDGGVWSPDAPIPGASGRSVNKLVVFSGTSAFAGSDCIAGQSGGAWRWNGSTWTDAGITAAGYPPCVRALFGTGPTDLFAVVGLQVADQRLIRWDGTSWQLVPGADVDLAENGHGVPGLSVVVKRRGGIAVGRPPAALVP